MIEALKHEDIVNKVGGKFRLTALIQKRMGELLEGARPMVERKPGMTNMELVIDEILQDKIQVDYEKTDVKPPEEMQGIAMNAESELHGYEVLLCVTGGIACYKAAGLASALTQGGAGVTVAMTPAAQRFVAPLTFQTVSGRQTYADMWDATDRYDPQHIALTDQADLLVVAPATANIIGKIASGIADELVSALVMSATNACPVLLAPAMNTRMWQSLILQANLTKLAELGFHTVGPNEGRLACGTVGPGRMAEPDEILAAAKEILLAKPPKNCQMSS